MAKIKIESKKAHIIWSETAKNSLQEIIAYIKQDSVDSARKVAYEIVKKTSRLESFPDSGKILSEFPEMPYREIIVGKYRIIYEHKENIVEIITILHGKRLLKYEYLS